MNCFTHRSKQFFLPLFFFSVFILGAAKQGFAQPDGAKIFKQNCSRCHTMTDQKLTGPGLKGLFERAPSETWVFDWIKNNKAMIAAGDAYAVKVFNDNGKQNMDVFEGILSDDDIKAVVAYIKAPPVEKKAEATTTAVAEDSGKKDESGEAMVLVVIALILIALIGIFGSVKASLQDAVNAKNGLPPAPKLGFIGWASQNKRLLAVAGLVIAVILLRAIYVGIMSISVYTNYLPAQPIKYSHATHAGKLQINCVYCHSGAEKGRTAGVPSANVCMNCHKAISEGPKTGKAEIAKIYEAVGWNPEKGVYDKPEKPIEWVRVHNLPDFAYFNHSQHVVAGKQDCANCHGDMTKLDEAKQNAPLTMGWCIDCHRKTEVPGMTTNPYYEELHAKLKEKYKGQPITVDKMGGLDCIKCHY